MNALPIEFNFLNNEINFQDVSNNAVSWSGN